MQDLGKSAESLQQILSHYSRAKPYYIGEDVITYTSRLWLGVKVNTVFVFPLDFLRASK